MDRRARANDRIKVLTDVDGDGKFDKVETYMDGLDLPAGICFWDGWTYVSLDHDIVRFKDADGDGKFEKREVVLTGFGNDDSHHRVSGLTIGPDGWLYATTGDSDAHLKGTDGSTSTVLRCGGVFRCKPDGSKVENVAFGMRNPFGNVCWDDSFNMFHTDNDNEGSPGFTGCRILHIVDGGDYGWRLREGARCCQPDFERATWNGGRPGRLGWIAETGRGAHRRLVLLELGRVSSFNPQYAHLPRRFSQTRPRLSLEASRRRPSASTSKSTCSRPTIPFSVPTTPKSVPTALSIFSIGAPIPKARANFGATARTAESIASLGAAQPMNRRETRCRRLV